MADLFSKARAKIDDLLSQTLSILQSKYAQSSQMFTVASSWGQILFVLQNLTQFILFFIEDSITEMNIKTATREASIYGGAAQTGHYATRAGAAIGEIQIVWNGNGIEDVGGGAILIPNKSAITFDASGTTYILDLGQDSVRFNLNQGSSLNCRIIQGIVKNSTFRSDGTSLQTYNVSERYTGSIDNYNVNVYVNDLLWKVYDSLYDIPYGYKGVLVKTSVSQGIDIIFGNIKNGAIPAQGSVIRVEYLETIGVPGNINASDPSKILFSFNSDGLDIFGNDVTLNEYLKINCVTPPQMGSNPESLKLTRILAPKNSRSYVLANPDSYITYFEKYGTFSQIEAYSTTATGYLDDQNVIYLLLVPDVTLKLTSSQNYFNLQLSDFLISDFQKKAILENLDLSGQKIVTTEISIVSPKVSRYVINTVITAFEGYDPDTIKNSIINVYSQYFLSIRRRDLIPRSDLIALVESIPGVDSVMVFFVSEKNELYQISVAGLAENDPKRSILYGLNNFGDIIMEKDEIIVISGGWTDSNNVFYDTGADLNKLSSVNIEITSTTPVTYNTQINAINKSGITI